MKLKYTSAASFLALQKCAAAFPQLEWLSLIFGYLDEGRFGRLASDGISMPAGLRAALEDIGLRTEEQALEVYIGPKVVWNRHRPDLEEHVYPMLQVRAG